MKLFMTSSKSPTAVTFMALGHFKSMSWVQFQHLCPTLLQINDLMKSKAVIHACRPYLWGRNVNGVTWFTYVTCESSFHPPSTLRCFVFCVSVFAFPQHPPGEWRLLFFVLFFGLFFLIFAFCIVNMFCFFLSILFPFCHSVPTDEMAPARCSTRRSSK